MHQRMIRHAACVGALLSFTSFAVGSGHAADVYDAALAHPGRTANDLKRDVTDKPADLLRLAGITSGMRVADVLAGDGYYTELLSTLVGPTGKVLLINNKTYDDWSDGLTERLAGNRLPNVEHLTVDLGRMGLPAASLDAVLLIKVYHDLYWVDTKNNWPAIDVGGVLDQLAAALKPNGVVLLVDHSAKPGTGTSEVTRLHRIDEAYAVKDFAAHGFKVVKRSDVLKRPDDARDQLSYKGPMYTKTDRFVLVLRKG